MAADQREEANDRAREEEASAGIPPMMQSLDLQLAMPELDQLQDVQVVRREFREGQGEYSVMHNAQLSHSLMTGSFTSTDSHGGITRYEGTLLGDPHREKPTPSGQGTRVNADGSSYVGQWKAGLPDGHGEWHAPPRSCEKYTGDWRKGLKHGFGIQKFENGDLYEGDWEGGVFHGRGKYVYANGDHFAGTFQGGNKQQGTIYFTDGRASSRKWEGGRLVSCQDFDSQKRTYQPTLTQTEAHDPNRTQYLSEVPAPAVLSPRGIRKN